MRTKRKFNIEFKRKLVEEIKAGVLSTVQACRQHELSHALSYRWMEWLHEERVKMEEERRRSGIPWSMQMQKEVESLQKQGFKIVEYQRK